MPKLFLDANQTTKFFSKYDKDKTCEFTIKPLDSMTKFYLDDEYDEKHINAKLFEMARICITDIKGIEVKKEPITVGTLTVEGLSKDTMKQIPTRIVTEICIEILKMNTLSDEERLD